MTPDRSIPAALLWPLRSRPLDVAIVITVAYQAGDDGVFRTTLAKLAVLVTGDSLGHGIKPQLQPSRDALMRALKRLEGTPGNPLYPRALWVEGIPQRGVALRLANPVA